MLTKDDLFVLLSEIEQRGIDTASYTVDLAVNAQIPYKVLKFINANRPLEVTEFYTMLRQNYNKKRSPLYKNLVRESFETPVDVLITLSALNLQIMLFAKKLPDNTMFLRHSRGEEITQTLNNYYKNYDLIPCLKLLKLIKNDLKCFEQLN